MDAIPTALTFSTSDALPALCRRFHVRQLYLFGSAADGRFNPACSDLDFLVAFEELPSASYAESYFGLREGLDIRFLSIPGGKDPDEYFSTTDASQWAGLTAGARSAMQFCVQSLVPEGSAGLPLARRLTLLEAIFPIVEQAGAEEIVREALNEAARHAGIGIREMHMAYERHRANSLSQRPALQLSGAETTPASSVVKGGGLTTPEEDLILFLLRHDSFFVPIAQSLPLAWLDQSTRCGLLLMALLNEAASGHFNGIREALNSLDDELRTEAARISAETYAGGDDAKELLPRANTILKSFHTRHVQTLVRSIDSRIASMSPDDVAGLNVLQSQKIALRKSHALPPTLSA